MFIPRKNICRLILLSCLLTGTASCHQEDPPEINIIPRPAELVPGNGSFRITRKTRILLDSDDPAVRQVASYLAERLNKSAGFALATAPAEEENGKGDITFRFNPSLARELDTEGYILEISKDRIVLSAAWPSGLFYGVQTLFQLLPASIYSAAEKKQSRPFTVPCLKIKDKPAFAWRGMHLDVSRHFFPKEFIKRYIDLLALHKMNVFHWHLTDDQGWRLEIEKYPELTQVAAWRVDREDKPWGERPLQQPGEKATYGGYYTREDVSEIIHYANERFVTIIPEIEMPGHSSEIFSVFPELSCTGRQLTVIPGSYWPNVDILCAGKEETFEFIENVLDEVAGLFPAEYIHIGGDEADKTRWKSCPDCQQRISEEGLSGEDELQSYFIRRVEEILRQHGKRLIGWDEILEGGLAPEATVMSWRGFDGGMEAARQGHDVIMCPVSHCYFDYYQADPEFEPEAIGGYLTLEKAYSFRPVPAGFGPGEARHVLGGQGNLWTEFIPSASHAEYMALPRMSAMAEVLWTKTELLDWHDFRNRLPAQFSRFDQLGVNYSRGSFRVKPVLAESTGDSAVFALETEAPGTTIYYTTDGSEPDQKSTKYTGSVPVTGTTTIKAIAYLDGHRKEKPSVTELSVHKAFRKPIEYSLQPSFKYPGSGETNLIDGMAGSTSHHDGRWQGFEGEDLDVVIDLGSVDTLQRFEAGFLQNQDAWIFLPASMTVFASVDGREFREMAAVKGPELAQDPQVKSMAMECVPEGPVTARFIRILARNARTCPPWHWGHGGKAWLFADEIKIW